MYKPKCVKRQPLTIAFFMAVFCFVCMTSSYASKPLRIGDSRKIAQKKLKEQGINGNFEADDVSVTKKQVGHNFLLGGDKSWVYEKDNYIILVVFDKDKVVSISYGAKYFISEKEVFRLMNQQVKQDQWVQTNVLKGVEGITTLYQTKDGRYRADAENKRVDVYLSSWFDKPAKPH